MTSVSNVDQPKPAPLPVTVVKATAADAVAVTAVLARAFDDDPFVNWIVAQDRARSSRIRSFMGFALKAFALKHDEVYTTPEFQGAALWNPPGTWRLSAKQQVMATPRLAQATGWGRLARVAAGLEAVEKHHPHEPHFYLLALGVEPEMQGRSIGTQLMQPVLERCDREGIAAYLESSKERNVPLYERNGFSVTRTVDVPSGGPRVWLMWREPAKMG